ncbi:hypothetical protein M1523_03735 [Patescibacteria group bacterium]|nr:hypothetical protein [Patescibacteria group bacterium]MCL5091805.1 hypothetical protein [Patescibacteria group bacterium]
MRINVSLPEGIKLIVKAGQTVDFGTVFCRSPQIHQEHVVLATKLNFPPAKIFQYLKKNIGDQIKRGEVVAEKGGWLGKHVYRSETDGVLKDINHQDGSIVVESDNRDDRPSSSYFHGEIEAVEKNKIVLKVDDGKSYPLKDASGNFGGRWAAYRGDRPLDYETVNGKIVVAEKLTAYQQNKLEALGVGGFVTCYSLTQPSALPHALLKLGKPAELLAFLAVHPLTYCIIDKNSSTMYFYQ